MTPSHLPFWREKPAPWRGFFAPKQGIREQEPPVSTVRPNVP